MASLLARLSPYSYAIMRMVAGSLFVLHGLDKLVGTEAGPLLSLMGFAGVVELGGGILITIGLFTSVAAFVASGQMAVAYFMVHAGRGFSPLANGGERAVLYCFVFLYLVVAGSGQWSVDSVRSRPSGSPAPAA